MAQPTHFLTLTLAGIEIRVPVRLEPVPQSAPPVDPPSADSKPVPPVISSYPTEGSFLL